MVHALELRHHPHLRIATGVDGRSAGITATGPTAHNQVVLDGFLRNSTNVHARDIVLVLRDALRSRQVYSLVLNNLHLTRATAEVLAEAILPSMPKMTSLAITYISGGSKPLNRLIRGLIPHGGRASGLSRLAVTNNTGRRSIRVLCDVALSVARARARARAR